MRKKLKRNLKANDVLIWRRKTLINKKDKNELDYVIVAN